MDDKELYELFETIVDPETPEERDDAEAKIVVHVQDLEVRLDKYEAEYGEHTSIDQGRGCPACAAAIRVKARERAATEGAA